MKNPTKNWTLSNLQALLQAQKRGNPRERDMNDLACFIADLENATIPELKKVWEEYFKTTPEQNSKPFLIRRIAYRVQEIKYGGLKPSILNELKRDCGKIIKENKLRTPEQSLRPGVVLTKVYKGVEFRVKVATNGFELNGMIYNSLTQVAKVISGSKTSGPLFFGLKGK